MKNVIASVGQMGRCIGCGVCTVVCPTKHLQITHNQLEELTVESVRETDCLNGCRRCSTVCPMLNPTKISDHTRLGDWKKCYVGFAPDPEFRLNGASGGMITYLANLLLEQKEIDAVLVVERVIGGGLYQATWATHRGAVLKGARSIYCQVNFATALHAIAQYDRVAIVGLPCFVKGIRRVQRLDKEFRTRVKYLFGIVCGQTKSRGFISYLSKKQKISSTVDSIDFRIKQPKHPISDYLVQIGSAGDNRLFPFSSYAKEWSFGHFTPKACLFCDDVFAEEADASFMDAWLPEWMNSDEGHNLLICRHERLLNLFDEIQTLQQIDPERVLKSQSLVIQNKRSDIIHRLRFDKENRNIRKELLVKKGAHNCILVSSKYLISHLSPRIWKAVKGQYSLFHLAMLPAYLLLYAGLFINKLKR